MYFIRSFLISFCFFCGVLLPIHGQMQAYNHIENENLEKVVALNDTQAQELRNHEGKVGVVLFLKGKAWIEDENKKRFEVGPQSKLFQGDTLLTEGKTLFQANFNDGSMIRLTGNGKVTINKYEQSKEGIADVDLDVKEGNFAIMVKKISDQANHNYAVSTESAEIKFKGTFGNVKVLPDGNIDFTLIPEKIAGEVKHSRAEVFHRLSGKKLAVSSDASSGANHIKMDKQSFALSKVEVDINALSQEFGLAFSEDGTVDVAQAEQGSVEQAASEDIEKAESSPQEKEESSESNLEEEKTDDKNEASTQETAQEKEPQDENADQPAKDDVVDKALSPEEEREQRAQDREARLAALEKEREENEAKRDDLREKISSGEFDADKDLKSESYFTSEEEASEPADTLAQEGSLSPETAQKEPEKKLEEPVEKEVSQAESQDDKGFIFESLALLGFSKENMDGDGLILDFSDVGFDLGEDEDVVFVDDYFDDEEGDEEAKGSAFGADTAAVDTGDGSGESGSEGSDGDGEEGHLLGKSGFLYSLAQEYIDAATGKAESMPSQDNYKPLETIVANSKEDFFGRFEAALAERNLKVPPRAADLNEDMWAAFHEFFMPYFIEKYQKELLSVNFVTFVNPMEPIREIEKDLLDSIPDQMDIFFDRYFDKAYNFYVNLPSKQLPEIAQEVRPRGTDKVIVSQEFRGFNSFNAVDHESREALVTQSLAADANKFEGRYVNTRETTGFDDLPIIQALGDLSVFEKSGPNPYSADKIQTLREALLKVKDKVDGINLTYSNDWTKASLEDLSALKALVDQTVLDIDTASAQMVEAVDENRAALLDLKKNFLEPMQVKLDEKNNLYLGIADQDKINLLSKLKASTSSLDSLDSFIKANVKGPDERIPSQLDFSRLNELKTDLNKLNTNLNALSSALHADDPLVQEIENLRYFYQIDSLIEKVDNAIAQGPNGTGIPPEELFDIFKFGTDLMEMRDQLNQPDITISDLKSEIAHNVSILDNLAGDQNTIRDDFSGFINGSYLDLVNTGGVLDLSVIKLNDGDAFSLPKGAIVDLEMLELKQDIEEVSYLLKMAEEANYIMTDENYQDFLALRKSFFNLDDHYRYLDAKLASDHPFRTSNIGTSEIKLWTELGSLISAGGSRLTALISDASILDNQDFEDMKTFLLALQLGAFTELLDDSVGQSLIDQQIGGALKSQSIQASGVRKGNLIVLNKESTYIDEEGKERRSRELAYLGKAISDADARSLSGIKKFTSKYDDYDRLPELTTSLFSVSDQDQSSFALESEAVVDFGNSVDKPRGYVNFFLPKFLQIGAQPEEDKVVQNIPELGYESAASNQEVILKTPIVSPSIFSNFEVKSLNVAQDELVFVEEGDLLLTLKKAGVPAGTLLDIHTQEHLDGFTVSEILFNQGDLVQEGDPLVALSLSNANKEKFSEQITLDNIPEGYQVKSLPLAQNQALVVEKDDLLLVLEYDPNSPYKHLHKDIEIRADFSGAFLGNELEVGDTVDSQTNMGLLESVDHLGSTVIVVTADKEGIMYSTGLEVGQVVHTGDKLSRVAVTSPLEFEDVQIYADKSGIFRGADLVVGDKLDSQALLGELVEDIDEDLDTFFLDAQVPLSTLMRGKKAGRPELTQDSKTGFIYYFDDNTGDRELIQFRGYLPLDESAETLSTPLVSDYVSSMSPEQVSFIGSASDSSSGTLATVDGLVVSADGIATDAQLLSTNFAEEFTDLALVSEDEGQYDFYGYASGVITIFDKIEEKLGSWSASNSKYLRMPTEFKNDGSGAFYEEGQLELKSGSQFGFGVDDDEINFLIDREHLLSTFSSAAGKGTMVSFPLPEFSVNNSPYGLSQFKPNAVMWGAWDIQGTAVSQTESVIFPGMHNFWATGIPTTDAQATTELAFRNSLDYPVARYQVMMGKTSVANHPDAEDGLLASSGGSGDLLFNYEDETWQGLIYFDDGRLLVGKGDIEDLNTESFSGASKDLKGFSTENGKWAVVDLLQMGAVENKVETRQLTHSSEDANGVGSFKGFFAGEQMESVVLTTSAQADKAEGDISKDLVTGSGIGALNHLSDRVELTNFVGYIDGVIIEKNDTSIPNVGGIEIEGADDVPEVLGRAAYFNLASNVLKPKANSIDADSLPTDEGELASLLEVADFIDVSTLDTAPATKATHNWVEYREDYKDLEFLYPESQEIQARLATGSPITMGDIIISATSGLEIQTTVDGLIFFHDGVVPGSTLTPEAEYATVLTSLGGELVDGLSTKSSSFDFVEFDGVEKGVLTLRTIPNTTKVKGLPGNPDVGQAQVVLESSLPTFNRIPDISVEYTVKITDLARTDDAGTELPFYMRFTVHHEGKQYLVELPKIDVTQADLDGNISFMYSGSNVESGEIHVFSLEGDFVETTGSLSEILADAGLDQGLKDALSLGTVSSAQIVFGGDPEVSGSIYVDSISIGNENSGVWDIEDDFEDILATPEDLIFVDKNAFYIAPASLEEAKMYLPEIQGMNPVDGTGFIATLKGLEDFEFLSFGLWRSEYTDGNENVDAMGFFAVGDANHTYTRNDHEKYLEALRQFNLPSQMTYYGLGIGAVSGIGRDGKVQVGQAVLNIDMFSGKTNGSVFLGRDVIDFQEGSLHEIQGGHGGAASSGMGFSGSAELRIDGAAASGLKNLGSYKGALFGKYDSDTIDAAKEAAGTFKAKNAAKTHSAVGAFGVKKSK